MQKINADKAQMLREQSVLWKLVAEMLVSSWEGAWKCYSHCLGWALPHKGLKQNECWKLFLLFFYKSKNPLDFFQLVKTGTNVGLLYTWRGIMQTQKEKTSVSSIVQAKLLNNHIILKYSGWKKKTNISI